MVELIGNLSLAWSGDFESLKKFANEILQLDGVWTQPGDDRKLFTFGDSNMYFGERKGYYCQQVVRGLMRFESR